MTKACCADCGLDYESSAWADVVIDDGIWRTISPDGEGNGLLCFNCINARLVRAGLSNVPARITSGPMARPNPDDESPAIIRFQTGSSWYARWFVDEKGEIKAVVSDSSPVAGVDDQRNPFVMLGAQS
jgi:hypothetical protein